MIDGYVTVSEIAKRWGLKPRTVQIMCIEGKIEGVTKFGRSWAIPANTEKPTDNRITTGEYRNWRKNS
ncbi:MAG: DNA-binding protein [Lachnospiraceae bacterium]|nr:DNA-binding protein [Lachnospiraceae bacterium]